MKSRLSMNLKIQNEYFKNATEQSNIKIKYTK